MKTIYKFVLTFILSFGLAVTANADSSSYDGENREGNQPGIGVEEFANFAEFPLNQVCYVIESIIKGEEPVAIPFCIDFRETIRFADLACDISCIINTLPDNRIRIVTPGGIFDTHVFKYYDLPFLSYYKRGDRFYAVFRYSIPEMLTGLVRRIIAANIKKLPIPLSTVLVPTIETSNPVVEFYHRHEYVFDKKNDAFIEAQEVIRNNTLPFTARAFTMFDFDQVDISFKIKFSHYD